MCVCLSLLLVIVAYMNLSDIELPYLMVICLKIYGYLSDVYMSGAVNSQVLKGIFF